MSGTLGWKLLLHQVLSCIDCILAVCHNLVVEPDNVKAMVLSDVPHHNPAYLPAVYILL